MPEISDLTLGEATKGPAGFLVCELLVLALLPPLLSLLVLDFFDVKVAAAA